MKSWRSHGRIEFVDVVDGDRMDVRPVGIHDMKHRHARVVAGNQAALARGQKHDPAVGQISWGNVVLAAVVPL